VRRDGERLADITLAGTRPVAPGPVDDDLPDHDAATMDRLCLRLLDIFRFLRRLYGLFVPAATDGDKASRLAAQCDDTAPQGAPRRDQRTPTGPRKRLNDPSLGALTKFGAV
jgi:hypothetical protein